MKLKAWILTVFNRELFFKAPLNPCVAGIYMYEGFVMVVVDLISQIFFKEILVVKPLDT